MQANRYPEQACDVTIAICTYNRIETLKKTIQSLSLLRGNISFEVLVVNGPSDDGTGDFLGSVKSIRVINNPEVNLSISRNIAIANAQGQYIAFIDDDAIPEHDWLDLIISHFRENNEISAVGGFIRDADGINFQAKYVFCDILGRGIPCDNPDYITFIKSEKRLYPSLTGTNTAFRTDDLRAINGFDEVFAYFLDETDVNKRMDDAGMISHIIPSAEIHHKYAASHLRTARKVSKNMYPIARSISYFSLIHGVPEIGWGEPIQRIQQFYRDEYGWKLQMLTNGDISRSEFEQLMIQTAAGIRDGIADAMEKSTRKLIRQNDRVTKHIERKALPEFIRSTRSEKEVLRLCMLSKDHSNDGRGGIGNWSTLVARGLAERGHEVSLIGELPPNAVREFVDFTPGGYWSHGVDNFGQEERNEVDCLGLPSNLANASKRRLSEFRRVNPRRKFQVISSPIWDVEGAAFFEGADIPTVLSLHTCAGLMLDSKPEWRENKQYFEGHVLKVINAEIQALRKTPMILANSKAILRDIGNVYNLKLEDRPHAVVPHGILDIENPDGLYEARAHMRANQEKPNIRILFLGRLETRKGIHDLIDIARTLLERGAPVTFDVVGSRVEAVYSEALDKLISEYPNNVFGHGYLSGEALDQLMRKSDIFVGPSLYESFGLIYAEAMRYSMPCVAYDVGGVTEVIESGVDGFLAPLRDKRALIEILLQMVQNEELLCDLSHGARKSFERKFGYRLMAERLERIYIGVCKGVNS